MASSRLSSHGPDWKDLAEMLVAFEEQNSVLISIELLSSKMGEEPDLLIKGQAWERGVDRRVAKPLAWQNVLCRVQRVRSVEGVLTYLLYQLDFLLAESEWRRTGSGNAVPPAKE